jgi:hypothetical protein
MKKIIVAALFSLFIIAVLSSCKSKDCPAYGQVEVEQAEING